MDIQAMIDKRANAFENAKQFLTDHTKDGVMSAEDAEQYGRMETEISDLTASIDRANKLAATESVLKQSTTDPIVEKPQGTGTKAEYLKAFNSSIRKRFKDAAAVPMSESTNGDYLVPDEWDSQIYEKLHELCVFRQLATQIKTSGDHKINIAKDRAVAAWTAEGTEATLSQPSFTQIELAAHKLTVLVKVTNELLADNAFNLQNYLTAQFAEAMAEAEEAAFLTGATASGGAAQTCPIGLLDATNGGTKQTALTAAVTNVDIINLIYSLKRPYRAKAAFIMNDADVAKVRKMVDENKQFMWQPALTMGEPDRLLGYPVYTSQYCTVKNIIFGDYSYYVIADREGRSVKVLNELYATSDMTGFYGKERLDGRLTIQEAVQILPLNA